MTRLSPNERLRWDEFKAYRIARKEHAWLLRAEGLKLQAIGVRLGVRRERARQMVNAFGRMTTRAMRRTRVTVQ